MLFNFANFIFVSSVNNDHGPAEYFLPSKAGVYFIFNPHPYLYIMTEKKQKTKINKQKKTHCTLNWVKNILLPSTAYGLKINKASSSYSDAKPQLDSPFLTFFPIYLYITYYYRFVTTASGSHYLKTE